MLQASPRLIHPERVLRHLLQQFDKTQHRKRPEDKFFRLRLLQLLRENFPSLRVVRRRGRRRRRLPPVFRFSCPFIRSSSSLPPPSREDVKSESSSPSSSSTTKSGAFSSLSSASNTENESRPSSPPPVPTKSAIFIFYFLCCVCFSRVKTRIYYERYSCCGGVNKRRKICVYVLTRTDFH